MEFKSGRVVALKHYTGRQHLRGILIEAVNNIVTIKPEDSFAIFSYFEDDPIVMVYDENDSVYIYQSTILSIDYVTGCFKLKVDKINIQENRREHEKYPTSLYALIQNSKFQDTGYIGNISVGGISIRSKIGVEEGDLLDVETNINGIPLRLTCSVIWKKIHPTYFDYGLKTISTTPDINEIIEIVKQEHISSIRKLKETTEYIKIIMV